MLCVNMSGICASTHARLCPTLNGSSALQHFKLGKMIEIRNGIMFDFYPGLPHIVLQVSKPHPKMNPTAIVPKDTNKHTVMNLYKQTKNTE